MVTIGTLIAEVRDYLNEPSTVSEQFFSDSELIANIKRSINDICIDTDANYFIYSLDITGSSVGTVTSINCSATINMTLAAHGLSTKDTIYISGITGTVSSILDNTYWAITVVDSSNFTIDKDGSDYAYTSGGTLKKMPLNYAFTSISASSTINLADLKFMAYRSSDWSEYLYDDLLKTDPRTNVSITSSELRRQSCIVYNNTIYLAKAPKIDDILLVAGRWLPTAITASTSTYPLGVVEEDATIKYTTAMGWLKKNKPEIASAWMNLYLERKKDIQLKRQRMVSINYPSALALFKKNDSLLDLLLRIPDTITT